MTIYIHLTIIKSTLFRIVKPFFSTLKDTKKVTLISKLSLAQKLYVKIYICLKKNPEMKEYQPRHILFSIAYVDDSFTCSSHFAPKDGYDLFGIKIRFMTWDNLLNPSYSGE